MPEPVRVAFLANSLGFGGAERHTLSLFRALSKSDFDGSLIVLHERPRELPEVAQIDDARIWRAQFNRGFDLAGIARLAAFFRRSVPDILVTVNGYPLLAAALAHRASNSHAAIINIFHTTELRDLKAKLQFAIYRPLMNRTTRVVYVCEAQRNYWLQRGLRRDKSSVIYNGIAATFADVSPGLPREAFRSSLGFAPTDVVVGICAGFRPEKAHRDLLAAIARLRGTGHQFKALLIGDGPCRPSIEQAIHTLGISKNVYLAGLQGDVRPFVSACDIMCLVSHSVETFSIAALEAMALSKPLVLSNVGGAAEQVQDGVNGYLFPKGDISALMDRLLRLSKSDVRHAMGANAARIVKERFSLNSMVTQYAGLLRECRTVGVGA